MRREFGTGAISVRNCLTGFRRTIPNHRAHDLASKGCSSRPTKGQFSNPYSLAVPSNQLRLRLTSQPATSSNSDQARIRTGRHRYSSSVKSATMADSAVRFCGLIAEELWRRTTLSARLLLHELDARYSQSRRGKCDLWRTQSPARSAMRRGASRPAGRRSSPLRPNLAANIMSTRNPAGRHNTVIGRRSRSP
jgi:hypothetical protein